MSQDLHLGGMSKRTHEGYLRGVRQLADFCKLSPDQITEDQLRRFFLHLKNHMLSFQTLKQLGRDAIRTIISAVKHSLRSGNLPPLPKKITADG